MKITVNADTCQRHGRCCATAPEVFRLDEAGLLTLVERPDERLRSAVEEAVDDCPTQSITLES